MCDQQSLISACSYAQSDQSLCQSLAYTMSVKLLTDHHLEFLSLKGGCIGSSESTLVEMPHCWKSRVTSHLFVRPQDTNNEVMKIMHVHVSMNVHKKDHSKCINSFNDRC